MANFNYNEIALKIEMKPKMCICQYTFWASFVLVCCNPV